MDTQTFTVRAVWDAEAKVWVAESDDVPGLVIYKCFDIRVRRHPERSEGSRAVLRAPIIARSSNANVAHRRHGMPLKPE
ncbi:MAG: DUF1902 domain-containing protein [Candidatus Binataceae bacterium]|jgi:hypothetical protein